jgi:hypothetical protein
MNPADVSEVDREAATQFEFAKVQEDGEELTYKQFVEAQFELLCQAFAAHRTTHARAAADGAVKACIAKVLAQPVESTRTIHDSKGSRYQRMIDANALVDSLTTTAAPPAPPATKLTKEFVMKVLPVKANGIKGADYHGRYGWIDWYQDGDAFVLFVSGRHCKLADFTEESFTSLITAFNLDATAGGEEDRG